MDLWVEHYERLDEEDRPALGAAARDADRAGVGVVRLGVGDRDLGVRIGQRGLRGPAETPGLGSVDG